MYVNAVLIKCKGFVNVCIEIVNPGQNKKPPDSD
jgi:hypothetical protein